MANDLKFVLLVAVGALVANYAFAHLQVNYNGGGN